jgi:hypothetical protein
MAGMDTTQIVLIIAIVVLGLYLVHVYDPYIVQRIFPGIDGFANAPSAKAGTGLKAPLNKAQANSTGAPAMGSMQTMPGQTATQPNIAPTPLQGKNASTPYSGSDPKLGGSLNTPVKPKEGFADLASMEGPAGFGSAQPPAGCYPRDQLTPTELLPADQHTIYAEQNPMGTGSLKAKNFLSSGALIGVNTVGQSLRNANLQLRSEPPNPQVPVSIFLQSTIQPDISHRPLEVGA